MLAILAGHVWPRDNREVKARVVGAMGLLVGAKLINTSVPFIFSHAIDSLNSAVQLSLATPEQAATTLITTTLIGYGVARAGALGFNELRNAVFAKVSQNSIRTIARDVFRHLHHLDLSFHLNRQTGGLSKTLDRGSRGIAFVLQAIVFNVVPTIVELSMVCGILAYSCGPAYATLALSTVIVYSGFTLLVTQWRTQFRVAMNRADTEAGNKAVDSLINYETVKYFNNEEYETAKYDASLRMYETANLKTTTSLALLNFGQNVIFSSALAGMMVMAAQDILAGNMSVGGLVMVNGLLFQLSVPLFFVGSVYREIRQALIDMQVMFQLMKVAPKISSPASAPPLQLTPASADIEFSDVRFGYLPGHPILDGVSFRVPAGEKHAIVGGSGSGKSTVVRLLYRFFEPDSGTVSIGGQPVGAVELASLRSKIAVVPQDSVLFHDTIRHNIQYGDLAAAEEQVWEAAQLAELHDTILDWPRGYDTQVGGLLSSYPLLGGRAGPQAVRGREAAGGDRPRHPEELPRAGVRRGHLFPRLADRGLDHAGAGPGHRRQDLHRHRPPPLHRRQLRQDPRAQGGSLRSWHPLNLLPPGKAGGEWDALGAAGRPRQLLLRPVGQPARRLLARRLHFAVHTVLIMLLDKSIFVILFHILHSYGDTYVGNIFIPPCPLLSV
jgi:ATP-binding cassette subfamily B (MDR/TAP) protein 7